MNNDKYATKVRAILSETIEHENIFGSVESVTDGTILKNLRAICTGLVNNVTLRKQEGLDKKFAELLIIKEEDKELRSNAIKEVHKKLSAVADLFSAAETSKSSTESASSCKNDSSCASGGCKTNKKSKAKKCSAEVEPETLAEKIAKYEREQSIIKYAFTAITTKLSDALQGLKLSVATNITIDLYDTRGNYDPHYTLYSKLTTDKLLEIREYEGKFIVFMFKTEVEIVEFASLQEALLCLNGLTVPKL